MTNEDEDDVFEILNEIVDICNRLRSAVDRGVPASMIAAKATSLVKSAYAPELCEKEIEYWVSKNRDKADIGHPVYPNMNKRKMADGVFFAHEQGIDGLVAVIKELKREARWVHRKSGRYR